MTQIMLFWQMIAYRQGFNRTDPNFDIAQLLGRKKTGKVNFVSNQFLSKSFRIWKLAELVTQLRIALNPLEFRREFNPRVAMSAYP